MDSAYIYLFRKILTFEYSFGIIIWVSIAAMKVVPIVGKAHPSIDMTVIPEEFKVFAIVRTVDIFKGECTCRYEDGITTSTVYTRL